jgi:hypothetical protein
MADNKDHDFKPDTKFNKQFLSALESDTVARRLSDIVQLAFAEKFNAKFDELIATVALLRREVEAKDVTIANLSKTCRDLENNNMLLKKQISLQDTQLKRDNLLFSGLDLPVADAIADENTSSRLVQKVLSVCNDQLGCDVKIEDISLAYAIPLKRNVPPRPNMRRQVVVKFTRRVVRDNVYMARFKLKNFNNAASAIFINEDLATDVQKLFAAARNMVKAKTLLGAWTNHSKVFVRKLDNSICVITLADLA